MVFQTVNPYTEEVIATYDELDTTQVDAVIERADTAFKQWRHTPVADRTAVLARAAARLRREKARYAEILTTEMGKVIGEAEAEVELSASILEYYVEHAAELLAPIPVPTAQEKEGTVYLSPEAQGVLYVIEPWNFPYYQLARIAAPQLSAGNVIILKHAENVPASALAFEELLHSAGAPDGVYTNVFVSHEMTDHILADPRVRGVALTGSERAGRSVAQIAAKYLKKSTLELGGADAFVVLDDAEVDKAADWAVFGRHWNAGQVCVSSKRLIVVDAVYDQFMARFREGVAKLKAGDPMNPETTLAPLNSQAAADGLQRQLDEAVAHGATAEQIGDPVPDKGAFFQPTILTGISKENPAFHTEFFGPVTQVYRVKDEAEAIEIANDSPYGLGGSVFTSDPERGDRVARALDTGMVYINHPTGVEADVPFGGVKNSGYGHELTNLGFSEFLNLKVIAATDIDAAF